MANVMGSGSEDYIGNETMPVCAHCHKVAALFFHPFYDFLRGIAISELGVRFDTKRTKLVPNLFQVSSILGNLVADCFRTIGSRRPTVCYVQ